MKIEEEIQQTKFRSPSHKAVLNIIFTGYWIEAEVNKILKPFGISEQQFNILNILRGQKGKPMNLYMISERMLHRMSNVTRLVEKLRLKGLVEREICPNNRRAVEITITEKGLEFLKDVEKKIAKSDFQPESKLTDKEAGKLSDLLDKLRE